MTRHPIIDTHVHFWNMSNPDDGLRWVWLEKDYVLPGLGDTDGMKSVKNDIRHAYAESRFADVTAFVHVQAAIGSADPVLETKWLTRMRETARAPFTIVGYVDLGSAAAERQLDGHSESAYFVGVRDYNSEVMLASGGFDSQFEMSLNLLTERNLSFDLNCEWMNMSAALGLARRHPGLQIVIEHIGSPRSQDDTYFSLWQSAIKDLARAENVTCKISGLGMNDPYFTAESLRPWIDTCVEAFSPDRCVLGSNWPLDRLYSSYDVIMDMYRKQISHLSNSEKVKILSENAAHIYKL